MDFKILFVEGYKEEIVPDFQNNTTFVNPKSYTIQTTIYEIKSHPSIYLFTSI